MCDCGPSYSWPMSSKINLTTCLARELALQEIRFTLVYPLPVEHKGVHLDCGYRIDIFVEDQLAVELRAVKEISGIHQAHYSRTA